MQASKDLKPKAEHPAAGITSKDLLKARRIAKRTRTYNACNRCKSRKAKCTDYRPCKRCANTKHASSCTSSLPKANSLTNISVPFISKVQARPASEGVSISERSPMEQDLPGNHPTVTDASRKPWYESAFTHTVEKQMVTGNQFPVPTKESQQISMSCTKAEGLHSLPNLFSQRSAHLDHIPVPIGTSTWPSNIPSAFSGILATVAHNSFQLDQAALLDRMSLAAQAIAAPPTPLVLNQSIVAALINSYSHAVPPAPAVLNSAFSPWPASLLIPYNGEPYGLLPSPAALPSYTRPHWGGV
jgi:hypothetical protein